MGCFGFSSAEEFSAYMTFVGLGMSMLFSFNSFISAPDYVKDYYKYTSDDSQAQPHMPSLWNNIESFISITNMVPNLVFQLLVFTQTARKWSMYAKILVSMLVTILSMLAVPVLPAFKVNEDGAAAGLLTAVGVAGAATAFFQSTVFALCASFPPRFMAGVLFGIGISGSTCSLIQIITKASMSDTYASHADTSRIYFSLAISWMMLSYISVILLKRNSFAKRYVAEFRDGEGLYAPITTEDYPEPTNDKLSHTNETSSNMHSEASTSQASTNILAIVKKIYPMMLSCMLTFTITLTVFPGVGVSINSNGWFGVVIIGMFQFGDTIGRFSTNISRIWIPRRYIPYCAMGRLIVVPLFFFCLDPRWITGNYFPMALMFLTGVSNGFIGSLSLIYGPQTETLENNNEKAIAGNCMSIALLMGLSAGSGFALLINFYVPGSSS